jgi:hypothetical protein
MTTPGVRAGLVPTNLPHGMVIGRWPLAQRDQQEQRRSRKLAEQLIALLHRERKHGLHPRSACGRSVQIHVRTTDDRDE